ncbi:hypothetical protein [Geobacter sp.]|uniref:hypothetical protein n=1 Tax=Geobacter sp. TaxID=46610 RepID=UPI002634E05A|nr:hypothetical protein [Geobacter sp.]
MKKILILLMVAGMFLCSAHAFALSSYSQEITFGENGYKVNPFDSVSLNFDGLNANLLDATLVFDVAAVTNGSFKIYGVKNFGVVYTDNDLVAGSGFHAGLTSFSSADESLDLAALNSSISDGTLGLYFTQMVGSTTIKSAKLSGTVAPEPVSMALVAAGLVGLPFVRRFRNSLH